MRIGLAGLLLLVGCATTSGIGNIGKDTYTLRREAGSGFSGLATLRGETLREAAAHCRGMGREFLLVRTQESRPPYVFGNYPSVDLDFMCLTADDPEYQRNRMRAAPDTTIEIRK